MKKSIFLKLIDFSSKIHNYVARRLNSKKLTLSIFYLLPLLSLTQPCQRLPNLFTLVQLCCTSAEFFILKHLKYKVKSDIVVVLQL